MSNKNEITAEIREAERELQALLEERTGLNARRAEAEEADNRALSVAHSEYRERTSAGKKVSKPVAVTQHRAEVEARATTIPTDIDRARLRLAGAKLKLVRIERGEAASAGEAPLERRNAIDEEIRQLEKERREADNALSETRSAAERLQAEESALDLEVRQLEKAVTARTRVSPLHGVVMG